jgi:hypothetical protein
MTKTTGFANPTLFAKAAIKETLLTTMQPLSSPREVCGWCSVVAAFKRGVKSVEF